jgi:hypothetical protein
MTLISQFQDSCFLFTFLEDFRKNPTGATPWMCLTLYDEFLRDKGLGLIRGDVGVHITRDVSPRSAAPVCALPLARR